MFDFIKISKQLPEGVTISTKDLVAHPTVRYKYGLNPETHNMFKYHNINIYCNPNNNKLIVGCSIPFLINGNNIRPVTLEQTIQCIKTLSDILGQDLFSGIVESFEFGLILETSFNFAQFTTTHFSMKEYISMYRDKKMISYNLKSSKRFKLYNVVKRSLQNRVVAKDSRTQLYKDGVLKYGMNYIKVENQYSNPKKYFGRELLVNDLLSQSFINTCGQDLINTYSNIRKSGYELPRDKKHLKPINLFGISLKQLEGLLDGYSVEEQALRLIDSIPDDTLSATNKYDRKKQIDKVLKDISDTDQNPYDLLPMLKQKLQCAA